MLALVTGANGFVGSHLVDRLLHEGHRVRILVRKTSDLRFLPLERVELHYGDIAHGEIPTEALHQVELLFHTAAILKAKDWDEFRRVNVDATLQLYRDFQELGSASGRFIFVSSQAAAGPSGEGPAVTEKIAPHPQTLYGRSKLEAENRLLALPGPSLTIIRPPAVYGPRDSATLPLFRLATKGWAFCMGSPERKISMIHVNDLTRGMITAALHDKGTGTFFLTGGKAHPWREIAEAFAVAAARRVRVVTLPDGLVLLAGILNEFVQAAIGRTALFNREKARDFTSRGWACSSEAAAAAFGYTARIPLAEGIAQTMAWYRDHGWL